MESTNKVSKEFVRNKLNQYNNFDAMSPSSYEQALDTIRRDPRIAYGTLFLIIRENKNAANEVISTSLDLYVYTGAPATLTLIEKSEDEYNLNGDLINEAKNT